jgi:thiol-disulfide isomerase/thioredoxin
MSFKAIARISPLVLLLLWALGACSKPQPQHHLTGQLLGFDGQPMKHAQIRIKPLFALAKKEATLVDVGVDGSYAFDFEGPQHYELMFMGVGHLPVTLVVDYQQQKGLMMDVQLDRTPFKENPDKVMVAVYTGVEGKDKPARHALDKSDNGHFTTSIDLPAGPVKYKVTGLTDGSYSVEDAQSSSFATSIYGNFFSLAQHEGGAWEVDITPPVAGPGKAETPVSLSGPWGEQAQTIELLRQYNRVLDEQRIAKVKAKEGDFEYATGLEILENWRTAHAGTQLQPLALAMSTGISGQAHAIHTEAVESIPVDSWLWGLPRVSFSSSVTSSGSDDAEVEEDTRAYQQLNHYDAKVKQFLAQSEDYEGKADVLMYKAYASRRAGDNEQYRQNYEELKANYSDAWSYDFYLKILEPSKLANGVAAPAFDIVSLEDEDVAYTNSSFDGKVYLLDFWATWCTPCLKEMPALHETYARFSEKGFDILSLSADLFVEDVTEFRQGKWTMPWKHAFLQDGMHPIIKSFDVIGYPTAYLIDEEGKVLATGDKVRGEQLEQTLEGYYR